MDRLLAAQLTSRYKFTMYPSPSAPLPLLRNEELILLRAEANVGLGRIDEATRRLEGLLHDLLGHTDTKTTEIYLQAIGQERRNLVMQAWSVDGQI